MLLDKNRFAQILSSLHVGGTHVIIGKNGAGKSRFFSFATDFICTSLKSNSGQFGRLVCLSGTMHDKYPRSIYMKEHNRESDIIYLGNKVNNNMVSDIAPFRVLARYILSFDTIPSLYSDMISIFTGRLNLSSRVNFRFRYAKGRKTNVIENVGSELVLDLADTERLTRFGSEFLEHIMKGDIILSDMMFERGQTYYGLDDLSSGEKQYILSILGVLFCVKEKSIVFFDEPENSLHPSWQLTIAGDISNICRQLHEQSTLIVATHSPLVASSLSGHDVYICAFPQDQAWSRVNLYGRTSDSVLREQFHLFSARSPEVAELINSCLSAIARGQEKTEYFREKRNELQRKNLDLLPEDPLAEVVSTILSLGA